MMLTHGKAGRKASPGRRAVVDSQLRQGAQINA